MIQTEVPEDLGILVYNKTVNKTGMNKLAAIICVCVMCAASQSCRTTKKINQVIAPKDSTIIIQPDPNFADSVKRVQETMAQLRNQYINFKTFNAKIKVEFSSSKNHVMCANTQSDSGFVPS